MYGTEKVLPEPSRETEFSGVHKDNCAARDLGALARVDAISDDALKKAGTKRDPREPARAPKPACACKIKLKYQYVEKDAGTDKRIV